MNIIKEVRNAVTIENNGTCSLGLNTNLVKKGGANKAFSKARKNSGYIYKDDNLTPFTLNEITEIDNKIVLYSKDLNCGIKPLLTDNSNNAKSIKLLVSALIKLKESNVTINNLSLNMFYYTDNGNLLIMPPKLIKYIDQRSNLTALEQSVTRINHPDLKGENSVMFSIGILLYQEFTGEYPVDYTTVEELRDKIRRGRISDPRWKNILLSDSAYNLLMSLIFQGDESETLITTDKKLNKS
ncbi:MAG: hypothetical protein B6229_08455 [Spirochaetaceae bacterium 4572_7]|nr:MAG: hypothetical protein B6229_08455 [Spirochaetaceae bacterium 4572_7]